MTTVNTPLGAVRGQAEDGYVAFRGIRYAQAPLGELRYRPSVAEIHPAVAAWLWCKDHRPEGSFWNYKEDSRIRDELWKIILDLTEFRELLATNAELNVVASADQG